MNCKDVKLLISELIDNELNLKLKKEVKTHLKSCISCNTQFKQLQKLNTLYTKTQAPSNLKDKILNSTILRKRVPMERLNLIRFLTPRRVAVASSLAIILISLIAIIQYKNPEYAALTVGGREPAGEVYKKIAPMFRSKKLPKNIQKIIKTANIEINIKRNSAKIKLDTIFQLTEVIGGYIVNSEFIKGKQSSSAIITIRIPENKLNSVIVSLTKLGKVKKLTQGGQDVTEEYVDIKGRINQLKSQESAIRRLYDRATKIPDLIEIQDKLSEVQTQIEQLQGQLNMLNEKISFATIYIKLQEPKIKKTITSKIYEFWQKNNAIEKGLKGFTSLVSVITIGSITMLPFVPIVVVIVLVFLFLEKRSRNL